MIDNHFNIGNTWERELLDGVIALNRRYKKSKVTEMYGCVQGILLSVRPPYRTPVRSRTYVQDYVKKAVDNGIDINYTFNMSCIGNIDDFEYVRSKVQKDIDWLASIGVARMTVFSPLLIQALAWPMKLEISTIHNNSDINYLLGLTALHTKIDKICLPIYMNRNFMQLSMINQHLPDTVTPELIVNEFCVQSSNTCLYRTECYDLQSHGGNPKKIHGNYPVGQCMDARYINPVKWIKAPAIYPQYLPLYNQRDFNYFKLTGRTHTSASVLQVLKWYMSRVFNGSVEELWGLPLDSATHGMAKSRQELYHIPVKKLVARQFLERFIDEPACSRKICGKECMHCEEVFSKVAVKREAGQTDKKV